MIIDVVVDSTNLSRQKTESGSVTVFTINMAVEINTLRSPASYYICVFFVRVEQCMCCYVVVFTITNKNTAINQPISNNFYNKLQNE